MGRIKSKKAFHNGIEFDSATECEYYKYLLYDYDVREIVLQAQYTLVKAFTLPCRKCEKGKVESPKTGNLIKCLSCKGTGVKTRQPWTYKADFRVTYHDGRVEVVDVKGWANERFPLVRKMFEYTQGVELMVVKKVKGGWKYV